MQAGNKHSYATNDEEEELALSLALAASVADAGGAQLSAQASAL